MPAATWLEGTRTALLIDLDTGTWPVVRWWGAAPGPGDDAVASCRAMRPSQPQSTLDDRVVLGLLPEHASGSPGAPGLLGAFADGTGWAPRFSVAEVDLGPGRLTAVGRDERAGLEVTVELHVDAHDVVAVRASVTNRRSHDDASGGYHLQALRPTLPLPDAAQEVATLTGRWIRELHLQRQPLTLGRVERVNVRGTSSHEDPPLVFVGSTGFGEEHGQVWAAHLAWPGNHELRVERTAIGTTSLQLTEYLHPGEIVLAAGETYRTPWLLATASDGGLNGVSDAFHAHIRARATHPRRPRPVTLNTWEAVYFDHDRARLGALIDVAAAAGIERFVLDDGWFRGRGGDTSGLGDWVVDDTKHPGGLSGLASRVRAAGMEFGLWVEPEMVNPGSERYRADPTVALAQPDGPLQRNQLVLDLIRDDVRASVLAQLDAVITDSGASALKWDLNRAQVAAEHDARPGSHAQVSAVTELLTTLLDRHPGLEIESCASGGGRIDLGILALTHRVWTSDCNDPVERQRIQRGASYLLPPELMGAHVGPPTAHTTFRTTTLSFRLATAFFGHLGVEWDLTAATPADRDRIAEAVALHRAWRDVLHGGRVVRVDHPDDAALVHGVVTDDRALFCHAQLTTSPVGRPAAVRCPGMVPDRHYQVRLVPVLTDFTGPQKHAPGWYEDGGVVLTGRQLAGHGVSIHANQPGTATVLSLIAVED